MPRRRDVNLADPAREPTDDQLRALAHEAFTGVAERHAEALGRLRLRIAELRAEARARLSELRPGATGGAE